MFRGNTINGKTFFVLRCGGGGGVLSLRLYTKFMLFKSGISIRFENWGEGGRGGGHFWYGDNSFLNQLSDEKSNRNTFIFISFSPLIIHITSLHRPNLKVNVRLGGFLL